MPDSAPTGLSPRQQQIAIAAGRLFMASGYGKVSMDAIARAAAISKATLYAHFPSKDALFAAVMGEACRRDTGLGNAGLGSNLPPAAPDMRAALTAIGTTCLTFLLQPQTQAIYRIAVAESVRFPELGRAFLANGPRRFLDRFADWLAAQSAAGLLAIDEPRIAAEQFAAMLRVSLFMQATLGFADASNEAEIAGTVAAAVDTFMRAFGPGR